MKIIYQDQKSSTVELVIHEGRYHQVKKMFHAVGFPVEKLHRSKYGDLELGDLKVGRWRELSSSEIESLL